MTTTEFSGQSTTFKTKTVGETLTMIGDITFNAAGISEMKGNFFKNDSPNNSIGYYGYPVSVNVQDVLMLSEASELYVQAMNDCQAKIQDLYLKE